MISDVQFNSKVTCFKQSPAFNGHTLCPSTGFLRQSLLYIIEPDTRPRVKNGSWSVQWHCKAYNRGRNKQKPAPLDPYKEIWISCDNAIGISTFFPTLSGNMHSLLPCSGIVTCLPVTWSPKAYVCPRMTQVMLMKRIPFTQVSVPDGWLVLRIFLALLYTENESRAFPNTPAWR